MKKKHFSIFFWTITSGMVGRNVYRLVRSSLPSPIHPWCLGTRIYDFIAFLWERSG